MHLSPFGKIGFPALAVCIASLVLTTNTTQASPVGSFSGPWTLLGGDHPAPSVVTTPGISTFGAWTGTIQINGTIDTTGAPGQVVLAASAGSLTDSAFGSRSPLNVLPSTASAGLEILSAPADGSFSFSYVLGGASHLEVYHGIHNTPNFSIVELTTGSSTIINFLAGESFGFRVLSDAFAGPVPGRGVAQLAASGPQLVAVFNPLIVVPETSTLVAGTAVLGMLGWICVGNRRRS